MQRKIFFQLNSPEQIAEFEKTLIPFQSRIKEGKATLEDKHTLAVLLGDAGLLVRDLDILKSIEYLMEATEIFENILTDIKNTQKETKEKIIPIKHHPVFLQLIACYFSLFSCYTLKDPKDFYHAAIFLARIITLYQDHLPKKEAALFITDLLPTVLHLRDKFLDDLTRRAIDLKDHAITTEASENLQQEYIAFAILLRQVGDPVCSQDAARFNALAQGNIQTASELRHLKPLLPITQRDVRQATRQQKKLLKKAKTRRPPSESKNPVSDSKIIEGILYRREEPDWNNTPPPPPLSLLQKKLKTFSRIEREFFLFSSIYHSEEKHIEELLKHNISPQLELLNKQSPLPPSVMIAIKSPHKERANIILRMLVMKGAKLHCHYDRFKSTPLMLAAGTAHPVAAHTLIALGVNTEERDVHGVNAFSYAAYTGALDIAKMIIQARKDRLLPALQKNDKWSIEFAVKKNNMDFFNMLVTCGSFSKATQPTLLEEFLVRASARAENYGNIALQKKLHALICENIFHFDTWNFFAYHAVTFKQLRLFEALINCYPRIAILTMLPSIYEGMLDRLLFFIIKKQESEYLSYFLERIHYTGGVTLLTPENPEPIVWTPLMAAANVGNLDMIKSLHEANKFSVNACVEPVPNNAKNLTAIIHYSRILPNGLRATHLMAAPLSSSRSNPKVLESKKSYVVPTLEGDIKLEHGTTAFMLACKAGHMAVAEYLLEQGADVNAITASGNNALFMAAAGGHATLLTRLLALPSLNRNEQMIARTLKYGAHHPEVVKILQKIQLQDWIEFHMPRLNHFPVHHFTQYLIHNFIALNTLYFGSSRYLVIEIRHFHPTLKLSPNVRLDNYIRAKGRLAISPDSLASIAKSWMRNALSPSPTESTLSQHDFQMGLWEHSPERLLLEKVFNQEEDLIKKAEEKKANELLETHIREMEAYLMEADRFIVNTKNNFNEELKEFQNMPSSPLCIQKIGTLQKQVIAMKASFEEVKLKKPIVLDNLSPLQKLFDVARAEFLNLQSQFRAECQHSLLVKAKQKPRQEDKYQAPKKSLSSSTQKVVQAMISAPVITTTTTTTASPTPVPHTGNSVVNPPFSRHNERKPTCSSEPDAQRAQFLTSIQIKPRYRLAIHFGDIMERLVHLREDISCLKTTLLFQFNDFSLAELIIERNAILGPIAFIMENLKEAGDLLAGFPPNIAKHIRDVIWHPHAFLPLASSSHQQEIGLNKLIRDFAARLFSHFEKREKMRVSMTRGGAVESKAIAAFEDEVHSEFLKKIMAHKLPERHSESFQVCVQQIHQGIREVIYYLMTYHFSYANDTRDISSLKNTILLAARKTTYGRFSTYASHMDRDILEGYVQAYLTEQDNLQFFPHVMSEINCGLKFGASIRHGSAAMDSSNSIETACIPPRAASAGSFVIK